MILLTKANNNNVCLFIIAFDRSKDQKIFLHKKISSWWLLFTRVWRNQNDCLLIFLGWNNVTSHDMMMMKQAYFIVIFSFYNNHINNDFPRLVWLLFEPFRFVVCSWIYFCQTKFIKPTRIHISAITKNNIPCLSQSVLCNTCFPWKYLNDNSLFALVGWNQWIFLIFLK